MTISRKTIIDKAKLIKSNVEKNQEIGISTKWGYYIAKQIINPTVSVKKLEFKEAPAQKGTHISRQIDITDYKELAENFIKFVEKEEYLPNYLIYGKYHIATNLYTYMFAKILVYINNNKKYPNYVNVNSKAFTRPTESGNSVYDYFVEVYGNFGDTIDGALYKVKDTGYKYYYDDKKSNKETIDGMKSTKDEDDPNCTDVCHVFYNITLVLIRKGKYRKVECLHVMCKSGGHVKLRITKNDGSTFIRDPACVISKNNKPINAVWCTNNPIKINPAWFMANLNR